MSFQMYVPTRILFGEGQLARLHEQKLPGTKAMIVISNGKSTKENGALERTEKEMALAGVETVLFDKIMANPLKSTVMEGAACAKEKLQEGCGVADLKMSDYGIQSDECMTLAQNARATMGGLFFCDRVPMSDEECAAIFEKAYR